MKCSVGVSAYGVQPIWTLANGDSLAVWVGFVRTDRAAVASKTTCDRTTASLQVPDKESGSETRPLRHASSICPPHFFDFLDLQTWRRLRRREQAFISVLERLISWTSQKPLPFSQSPGAMRNEHLRRWSATRPV